MKLRARVRVCCTHTGQRLHCLDDRCLFRAIHTRLHKHSRLVHTNSSRRSQPACMQALADGISQLMLHIWKASGVHRQTAGLQRVGSLSAERVRLALHTRNQQALLPTLPQVARLSTDQMRWRQGGLEAS